MATEPANRTPAAALQTTVADEVAQAHAAMGQLLLHGDHLWQRREPGISAHVSGQPCASSNGIYIHDGCVSPELVEELIAQVAAHGLPFTVKLRSGLSGTMAPMLEKRGLVWSEDLPLMAVEPTRFAPALCPAEVVIRTLAPTENRIHMDLVAYGLGAPREALEVVMSDANQAAPNWTTYVGEVDGELAVTASAIAGADHVGLIAIATEDRFRRRGYGAALTSRAVSDAFAGGAARVFLHSSQMGYRIYEALGFCTLEHLSVWASGD